MVSVTLKKIYIIFIYKYWNYNFVSVILKKIKITLIICVVAKFPKDIFPIVSISVITSISLRLHQPSTIPDLLRIGSHSKKCYEMIEWKQGVQKLRRFDIETT